MISMGSGSNREKYPSWSAPLTRYTYTGQLPQNGEGASGQGLFADTLAGGQAFSGQQAFGGLAGQVPNAQNAGFMARDLAAQGTNQGWGNLSNLANMGWGPVSQMGQLAGMVPNAMDASNYYLQGVTGAANGGNVQGGMGAGQQVVDAALAAPAQFQSDIYQRAIAEGLPQVRASYSARGLGTGGEAARGEQDYVQRISDDFAQQAVQARLGALGVAANAASPAASQAIGAQQAAIGRGQLGLGAAGQIPGMLSGFQDVAGAPLGAMQQMAAMQGLPLELANQGLSLYGQGLQMPLAYQQALYNFTRQPQLDLVNSLNGMQLGSARNWNFGIASKPSSGGGGGGGGN